MRAEQAAERHNLNADDVRYETFVVRDDLLGRMFGASDDLQLALRQDAQKLSVLHAHGLWHASSLYPAWAKQKEARAKLIHAPRGMLGFEALKISAWKKKPFWHLLQKRALQTADCFHATALSELYDIRRIGLKSPVAVIPNGIDVPKLEATRTKTDGKRVLLSLGRIHPKKGLDRLINSWSKLETQFPNWRLRIVGPAEVGYDKELIRLIGKLELNNVSVEPPVFGDQKFALYQEADLFILPTLNENFAITVAEALAAQTPVISTKGAPWSALEVHKCGWWIDHGVAPMIETLQFAMNLPAKQLTEMGHRGRAWMTRDFGWDQIAEQMLEVYEWLNGSAHRPSCVELA